MPHILYTNSLIFIKTYIIFISTQKKIIKIKNMIQPLWCAFFGRPNTEIVIFFRKNHTFFRFCAILCNVTMCQFAYLLIMLNITFFLQFLQPKIRMIHQIVMIWQLFEKYEYSSVNMGCHNVILRNSCQRAHQKSKFDFFLCVPYENAQIW